MKKKIIVMAMALCMVAGSTEAGFAATETADYQHWLQQIMQRIETHISEYINGSMDKLPEQEKEENPQVQGNMAKEVVSLTNAQRKSAGLNALKSSGQLTMLAQLKAEDMAKNGYFSHTSPTYGSAFDMMKAYGVSYKTAGENIAKGQKSAQSVINGWMGSSGHRANILNSSYTEIGVGYAQDRNGNTYWVQIFKG